MLTERKWIAHPADTTKRAYRVLKSPRQALTSGKDAIMPKATCISNTAPRRPACPNGSTDHLNATGSCAFSNAYKGRGNGGLSSQNLPGNICRHVRQQRRIPRHR